MFDPRQISGDTPRETTRQRGGLRYFIGALILAIVVIGIGVYLSRESLPLSDALDNAEKEVQTMLVTLTWTAAEDGPDELKAFVGIIQRYDKRIRRAATQADSTVELKRMQITLSELGRLGGRVRVWQEMVRGKRLESLSMAWRDVQADILMNERGRWPLGGVIRPNLKLKPRHIWADLRDGLVRGSLWPLLAVKEYLALSPGSGQSALRRAFFPFTTKNAFNLSRLTGITLASIGTGYFFCWLGMRFNRGGLSNIGLVYFVYIFAFGAALICLHYRVFV